MKAKVLTAIVCIIFIMTGCTTNQKFSVICSKDASIIIPNEGINTKENYGPIQALAGVPTKITYPSDGYLSHIYIKDNKGSEIPMGINIMTDRHSGAKTGLILSYISLFPTCLLSTPAFCITFYRWQQTCYQYNFSYINNQPISLPTLSSTLLHPDVDKSVLDTDLTTKNVSSITTSESIATSDGNLDNTVSTINRRPRDMSKAVVGTYIGKGQLFRGNIVEETYDDMTIIIERLDKNVVKAIVTLDEQEFFSNPIKFEVVKNGDEGYILKGSGLSQAEIIISHNGRADFVLNKVKMDNEIFKLTIKASRK